MRKAESGSRRCLSVANRRREWMGRRSDTVGKLAQAHTAVQTEISGQLAPVMNVL